MTVYVEFVIVDNMVVDSMILLLTKEILKINTKKINIFLSALLGTIIAIVSPMFSSLMSFIIKIPLSLSMVMIAFCPKRLKNFLIEYITFFASTFVLIGTCLGISEIFGLRVLTLSGYEVVYNFPVGFAVLVCALTFVCLKNIIKYANIQHKNGKLLFEVTLKNRGKTVIATAFLDTGNKLVQGGKNVSIINYKVFSKLFENVDVLDVVLQRSVNIENSKYIKVSSLGKSKRILIFEIEELIIKNKSIKNATLGLALNGFEQKTQSDVIISNNLMGEFYEN